MNTFKNLVSMRFARLNKNCYSLFLLLLSTLTLNLFAAGLANAQAPVATDFQRTVVAAGLDLSTAFEISKDGRIFIVSKCGKFYGWKLSGPANTNPTSIVPNVRCEFEDGLLSIAIDPNFTTNGYVYLQYTSPGSKTRVSRFVVRADNSLDTASEKIVLEWITGREASGHMGGTLKFDKNSNLLISTGDNNAATGYFAAGPQETSANSNDLRGKVLRITPTAAGGYTIPAGNLFPQDATHRGEIYGMGFRNPYRLNIDPLTNIYYLGDIGPDANGASAEGPMGMDELNELKEPGNYGWPYVVGFNQPYAGWDPVNNTNNYPTNTGAKVLPPAKPAIWTIMHRATMVGPVYRINDSITNEFKLPAYFDGRLIYWDFNSSKFFTTKVSDQTRPAVVEDLPLNTSGFQGANDAVFDPTTQQLYVLQWGSGCCDHAPANNGALYRFDYIGNRDNGTNLALAATVVSSTSVAGGNNPGGMLDGNLTTRWESNASDPQGFVLDLRTSTDIASIVIKWEAAYSSQYTIEGAASAAGPWDLLVDEKAGAGATELKMINTVKKYQFIRFNGTKRATAYGHSIYEFEVYAAKTSVPTQLTQFAYLNMPRTLDATFTGVPKLLSQTGAFKSVANANLVPIDNMVPFTPISQLWSDRAVKSRWISIPMSTKINWNAKDNWTYPQGTVAVKHFALPVDAKNPATVKPLETRLVVTKADGKVYGVTYKWRADGSDADLLTTGATQDFTITNADNTTTTQTWTYPSPQDCLSCHNAESSQILGLSTRQINSNYTYPGNVTENQLVHFNNLAMFSPAIVNSQVDTYDKLAALSDTSADMEKRIKSYLDANCAHCHGTGNGASQWDARYYTPLAQMKIVDALTTGIRDYSKDYGILSAKVVASGKAAESILYIRDKSVNPSDRMPPIGRSLEHTEYITLLNQWITGLSGINTQKVLLSKGKPVTVSSFEGDLIGSKAVDGDTTTRWGSAFADPQTIEIDLQAAYNISEIMLQWEAAFGKDYKVDGSLDRATWTNMVTQINGTGGIEIHNKVTGKYRYIRLTGTARGTAYGYSLFEFEVWGSTDVISSTPSLTVSSPTAGQQYNEGSPVSLQVAVSDSAWFTAGNSYSYTLDNGAAVIVTNGNAVNLGTPSVGTHNLNLQLLKAGAAVGTAVTRSFTVNAVASGPISVGKPVTSSAVTGTNVAANATDNNTNTRWESVFADNQFIQIDLGVKMNISQVVLNWEGAYGKGYNIEVSDTGSAPWTQLFTTTTGDGGVDTLTVSGQGRYVRLNCVTRGTPWGFSLWEFTVMGSAIGSSTPTISITAPTANQSFTSGTAVNLQVAVSDAAWFTAGNSYTYKLDSGTAVKATNTNAVNLGTPTVGTHTVTATLYNAANAVVGTAVTTTFSVATASTPTISITTPAANQEFNQGTTVNLQVAVSDAAWFTAGNSYSYKLDNGTAVKMTNATAVSLGAPALGTHTVTATLYNAAGTMVGTTATSSFVVKTSGSTPPTPSPAKLTPLAATASSFQGANTAAAGIDGNTTTRWESATTDPQYLQLDMGKSIYFTQVVLNWEAAYGKAYTIDVSENGTDWTNAYTTTNGIGGIENITLDGQRGRYIRMRGTVRATTYGYSLFEFDAYGVPVDANPALISFVAPAADAVIAKTTSVSLQVAISDTSWVPNGSYNYYLDFNTPVKVNNLNAINLGLLATGPHTLKVSLVNSSGVEVSVPKTRKFRVSCGTSCPSVLIFSKTSGYRHDSIPAGIAMVQKIATENGYTVAASEDSSLFTTANLAKYSTIVFMNTTGDIFDANQKAAFQAYIENGGGWVGTHSAADTEHNWPWYTGTLLAGAEFINHGDGIPRAKVKIEQPTNGLVNHIGTEWWITDEWYFWKNNPRNVTTVTVLGNLDRSSYPSNSPVADHPVIYTNTIGKGRTFYTAIGHVDANFSDPKMTEMIRKAIEWTSNK